MGSHWQAGVVVCDPASECALCPRLVVYREANRRLQPDWHNSPVASWGARTSSLLIVGLAPGRKGANRTGRVFTGDASGDLLFRLLVESGFATGVYLGGAGDGVVLQGCMITNAVRCVPPVNRPTAGEIERCRPFLEATIGSLPRLRAILALGRIAHDSTLRALAARPRTHVFGHGARHAVRPGLTLFDSYHCSRYNTSTGRLTPAMLRDVLVDVHAHVARQS